MVPAVLEELFLKYRLRILDAAVFVREAGRRFYIAFLILT